MNKHASGPWYYQDWTDQPTINDMPIIVGSRVGEIAQLHDHPGVPFEIAQANARLMAKAPEMLKELRFMVINCCGSVEEPKNKSCTKCLSARLLIAEIEGES